MESTDLGLIMSAGVVFLLPIYGFLWKWDKQFTALQLKIINCKQCVKGTKDFVELSEEP